MDNTCVECKYFEAGLYFSGDGQPVGTCYRFPPVYTPTGNKQNDYKNWSCPTVCDFHTCGEFKPLEKKGPE